MVSGFESALLAATLLVALPVAAGQSLACKVLDPELQDFYEGPCLNGLAEGQGIARGIAEYAGGFRAGMKHGRGVKRWPNGDRYEGEFVADRKEGRGEYHWGQGEWEGESYRGAYLGDKRHGEGTYRWPTGDVYRGPWVEDRIAGYATPMMLAQRKFAEEAMRAVGREGQEVCREADEAAARSRWLRGRVIEVTRERVAVRVSQPGGGARIAGVELQAGDIVWDKPTAWTPCW